MEEVNKLLDQFLISYKFNGKNPKNIFNHFLQYVFLTFENLINGEKKYKNKYIMIRKQLLQLIFVNRYKITASISKKIR